MELADVILGLGIVSVALLAAISLSVTAFGFALVMVPLLSLFWDVKEAVMTSTILATFLFFPLIFEIRRELQVVRVAPMLVGSLLGIPLGLVLFERLSASTLQAIIAVLVIVSSVLFYISPQIKLHRPHLLLSLLVGALNGSLSASTSMGGPPVVLYALSLERKIESFRALLLALFLPTNVFIVIGLIVTGLLTDDVLIAVGASLPLVLLGTVIGSRLRTGLSVQLFRKLVLVLLIGTSGAILGANYL